LADPSTPGRRHWRDYFPLLKVRAIRKPRWKVIPALQEFQEIHAEEKLIRSYHIRVERPKFPWVLFLTLPVLFLLAGFGIWTAQQEAERAKRRTEEKQRNFEEHLRIERHFEEELRRLRQGEPAGEFRPSRPQAAPPERDSTNPILVGAVWLAVPVLGVILFHLGRSRGHTFLYLTSQRVIVLEVSRSLVKRSQTVLNYSLSNVAGFTLHAQRGLKKLLNLILLKEKRAFYLSIITRTSDTLQIGAVNTRGGRFDPGRDAVTLCGELDSMVLAIKAGKIPT
jgi:hypothetical protein